MPEVEPVMRAVFPVRNMEGTLCVRSELYLRF
jgi:hypothetical protein